VSTPATNAAAVSAVRRPGSRRSQVADLLREAIVSGELGAGERLKQDVLCARFGLSPTPVREALRELESEGLVRHFPNRGVVVCDISPEELLGVLVPVRMALESFALPVAAREMPPESWRALAGTVEEMERAATEGKLEPLNDLDVRFHELAMEASGYEHAVQLWRAVLPRIRLQFGRLAPLHAELGEVPEEHRRLLAALETRDEKTIVEELDEHIVRSAEALVAALATSGG
jgi:DNA-binding GntR family transcriptional regulator